MAGNCCFVAGTQVRMADGSLKPIEQISVGDEVLSFAGAVNTVQEVLAPPLAGRLLYAFNGGMPFVTDEHPFMTTTGWRAISVDRARDETPGIEIGHLLEGDELYRFGQRSEVLHHVKGFDGLSDQTVYNLKLDGDHMYFADDYLVHNKGGDREEQENLRNIRNNAGGGRGLTEADVKAMINEAGLGDTRYAEQQAIIDELRQQALDIAEQDRIFREEVYGQSLAGQQELQGLASDIARQQLEQQGALFDQGQQQYQNYLSQFAPQETLMAARAMGLDYLDPAQQQALMGVLNNPNLDPASRANALQGLQQQAMGLGEDEIRAQADTIEQDLAARGQFIKDYFGQEAADLWERESKRAMDAERRNIQQSQAAVNQAYGGMQRELGRRGFNPAQIAEAATAATNAQALANLQGANQAYGITSQRMTAAEDAARNLRQQGDITGMNVRFGGEDMARGMRLGAADTMRQRLSGMGANAAAFGRNMPAFSTQAAGTGAQIGTQAVANQASGFQAGLPYAQFATGGTGFGLQATNQGQMGQMGIMDVLSGDWRTKYSTDNAPDGGGGGSSGSSLLGAALGFGLGFSDRRVKENIHFIRWLEPGVGLYSYNLIGEDETEVGVMADEIETVLPECVHTVMGLKAVDYDMVRERYGLEC